VELVVFDGAATPGGPVAACTAGFFLLSFFVDVSATLARLEVLGLGGAPRRIEQPGPGGPVGKATVRGPDGVLIELIQTRPAAA
jgi:catechol 2,3-dioxygenase-like lactoylglutathione lyase family enzyme